MITMEAFAELRAPSMKTRPKTFINLDGKIVLCANFEGRGLIQSQVETKTFPGGVAGNC